MVTQAGFPSFTCIRSGANDDLFYEALNVSQTVEMIINESESGNWFQKKSTKLTHVPSPSTQSPENSEFSSSRRSAM